VTALSDELHEVGPRILLPFPVMTDAGFPHGLRCDTCLREITEGQPYREDVDYIYDNGDSMSTLRCVYCPATSGTPDGGAS